jgi:hypothetical protein
MSVTASRQDREELRRLVDAYATAADTGNDDLLVSLFSADGALTIYQEGVSLGTFAGPDGLRQAAAPLHDYHATMHITANHTCTIEGDTARGVTYCLANHLEAVDGGFENVLRVNRFDDRYVREGDGAWRFSARDVHILWTEIHPASIERLRF